MDNEQRPPTFMPLPTQFLQPEASEDDEDEEMNFLEDDYDDEQPLMQIKMNRTGTGAVVSSDGSGISPNIFYGNQQASEQVCFFHFNDVSSCFFEHFLGIFFFFC